MCPTDLELEGVLGGGAAPSMKAHVTGCPPCTGRIERMRAEAEEFREVVFPATVEAVLQAAHRGPCGGSSQGSETGPVATTHHITGGLRSE